MHVQNHLIIIGALLLAVANPALARDTQPPDNQTSPEYYRSSDGSMVHRPSRANDAASGKVTADCRDGTHSYSHHHSGTCSGHGGVSAWR
jgi:hypothetical protein